MEKNTFDFLTNESSFSKSV